MKNNRIFQFAVAGFSTALLLLAVGYAADHAAVRVPLEEQVLYNWLSLLFTPIIVLFRLTNPDGPIVASWSAAVICMLVNAGYYALSGKFCQIVFSRLSYKLRHEENLGIYSAPALLRRVPSSALDLSKF